MLLKVFWLVFGREDVSVSHKKKQAYIYIYIYICICSPLDIDGVQTWATLAAVGRMGRHGTGPGLDLGRGGRSPLSR